VVAGAVLAVGESEAKDNTVISLAPDPALLFGRLKSLQPGIRRVTVVYSPAANEWLIRLARIAAKAHDIELNALPADDLKTALKQYMEFFAASNKGDALWLPQDGTTVEESAVVPLVLKESWNRGIPLFSSSLAHVRRGALFALYPNNIELGKDLANFALGYLGSGARPSKGLLPLRGVMAAVNARTASHLGISLNQHSFDLLLPER
jgi:putative ABC transport system substrate-binding protein